MLNIKKYLPNVDTTQPTKYPYGAHRNDTVPGDQTGTPALTATVQNDYYYSMGAVVFDSNITPSNNPENVQQSDFLDALNKKVNHEWNAIHIYSLGELCFKVGSSSLLGSDANRYTMIYRSKVNGNVNKVLPNDFVGNTQWDFINAWGPQNLNKLDFGAHVGSIAQTSAEETNIPANWGLCDGRSITMPDGTTQNTPDLRDKFLIASSDDKAKGTMGGSFTTAGHALTIDQMPRHNHAYSRQSGSWGVEANGHRIADISYGTFTTNNTGGNQPHPHDFTPPYYSVYYIRRMF